MPPHLERTKATGNDLVSMKSGLEGRNNWRLWLCLRGPQKLVSMKSGLEGRNNLYAPR